MKQVEGLNRIISQRLVKISNEKDNTEEKDFMIEKTFILIDRQIRKIAVTKA